MTEKTQKKMKKSLDAGWGPFLLVLKVEIKVNYDVNILYLICAIYSSKFQNLCSLRSVLKKQILWLGKC